MRETGSEDRHQHPGPAQPGAWDSAMTTVAALMATTPARSHFWSQAEAAFLTQRVPDFWLLELLKQKDDSPSLGWKLNTMISSWAADFYIIHDDDDAYMPDRIFKQIQPMIDNPALMVTGTSRIIYEDLAT